MIDKRAVQCFDQICGVFTTQSLRLAALIDGKVQARLIVLGAGTFLSDTRGVQSVSRLYGTVTSPIFALQGAFHREWCVERGNLVPQILRVIPRAKLESLCARILDLALDAE